MNIPWKVKICLTDSIEFRLSTGYTGLDLHEVKRVSDCFPDFGHNKWRNQGAAGINARIDEYCEKWGKRLFSCEWQWPERSPDGRAKFLRSDRLRFVLKFPEVDITLEEIVEVDSFACTNWDLLTVSQQFDRVEAALDDWRQTYAILNWELVPGLIDSRFGEEEETP